MIVLFPQLNAVAFNRKVFGIFAKLFYLYNQVLEDSFPNCSNNNYKDLQKN